MEIYYLITITTIAISSVCAIYFIVKANASANQEIISRLTNAVLAESHEEYVLLNEADERIKKPRPEAKPNLVPVDDALLEEVSDEAIDQFINR